MANLNDLDLKICATEGDVPSGAPDKDQLILVRGEGGSGGTPQEVPSGTTLLPNVDYVKIPTANVTYTLGTPIPGIVNHYHLTWMNYTSGDSYRPAFSGVQIIWAEACGDPPTSVDGGTWLEFSIMYVREGSDYAYIGMWTQIT